MQSPLKAHTIICESCTASELLKPPHSAKCSSHWGGTQHAKKYIQGNTKHWTHTCNLVKCLSTLKIISLQSSKATKVITIIHHTLKACLKLIQWHLWQFHGMQCQVLIFNTLYVISDTALSQSTKRCCYQIGQNGWHHIKHLISKLNQSDCSRYVVKVHHQHYWSSNVCAFKCGIETLNRWKHMHT